QQVTAEKRQDNSQAIDVEAKTKS
ncbi:MAG: hypothetical protein RL456_698, partial [Pseudomonadota bacterium]